MVIEDGKDLGGGRGVEEDSALKGRKAKCGGKRPQPEGRISLSFVFTCFFNPDRELEEGVSR